MRWAPFSMVRIALVFIAGILVCIDCPGFLTETCAAFLLVLLICAYPLMVHLARRTRGVDIGTGVTGMGAVFLSGYLTVLFSTDTRQPDHLVKQKGVTACRVKLVSACEERENGLRRIAVVQAVCTPEGWHAASGKINLVWPRSEPVANLDFGDILFIRGTPQEIEGAQNPNEFDVRQYLGFRNIHHRQFVKAGEWKLVERSVDYGILFYALRARIWAVGVIRQYILAQREQAIVDALVLGVTDGLDGELQGAYAASGAMHVLAVSGLHVSIIYGMLLLFLNPVQKLSGGRWIVACLCLVLIWAYAILTGLSPSVLRAVAMFSFAVVSRLIGRTANIYNTLGASAFCLLLYDPMLLKSVGFQLSYLAVWGIVYFQKPLLRLWEVRSLAGHWIWQLTCVSIAAQLATFALGLLYFHQFPVYFLLSNLFVIPGSFAVLVGGILLLIVSPISTVANWVALGVGWVVKILNEGVFFVERLPMSLVSDVSISPLQCGLLLLLVLAIWWLVQYRRIQLVWVVTTSVLLFSAISWWRHFTQYQPAGLTVYSVRNHSAVEWSYEGHSFFLADSALLADPRRVRMHIHPNRLAKGIQAILSPPHIPATMQGNGLYYFAGKSFLRLDAQSFRLPVRLVVDYLIVGHNAVKDLKAVARHVDFKQLIFDSSNSYRYCERMEEVARQLRKPAYSVLKNGAYTISFITYGTR